MKKICVVTGSRAEYGLLYWCMKRIMEDSELRLQVCVTGMHLSHEFGLTFKEIEKDGFKIDEKIEILLSSDSAIGVTKSIGLGVIGFAETFSRLKPDIILLLGDRFEIFSATIAALINRIPVAHCHGGEGTEGLIDESIRHSITKMSHLHFTATEEYRQRVIQLGEQPKFVFNVGALGIENINKLKLLTKKQLEESIEFKLGKINFLITYHPVTLETNTAHSQFTELLIALDEFQYANMIFTKPNSDTEGRVIIDLIDQYVLKYPKRSIAFLNLGQLRYLSVIKHVDVVIGNSSSGIIEVPSFSKATVNIGDRQRGRISGLSVINSLPDSKHIKIAINKAISKNFRNEIKNNINPYGNLNSSDLIINKLKEIDLNNLIKKVFFNIKF